MWEPNCLETAYSADLLETTATPSEWTLNHCVTALMCRHLAIVFTLYATRDLFMQLGFAV